MIIDIERGNLCEYEVIGHKGAFPGPVRRLAALSLFVVNVKALCFMPSSRPEASRSAVERDFTGDESHSSQREASCDSLFNTNKLPDRICIHQGNGLH